MGNKIILSHFSETPFKLDTQRIYMPPSSLFTKPVGLWLSDESDYGWHRWCEDEEFRRENLEYETKFIVEDDTHFLVIDTVEKLLKFTDKYKLPFGIDTINSSMFLDWLRVRNEYTGILITPYQYSLRLHTSTAWYYGWDCASACVWDLSILKEVEK